MELTERIEIELNAEEVNKILSAAGKAMIAEKGHKYHGVNMHIDDENGELVGITIYGAKATESS